jgi:hypothetical protein
LSRTRDAPYNTGLRTGGHWILPRIVAVGTAVPQWCYTQRQLLEIAGPDRTREPFFLRSDIDCRDLYFPPDFRGEETTDQMQDRARRGATEISGAAIVAVSDAIESRMAQARHSLSRGANPQKPEVVPDYRRILDRKDIDAVFISTTQHWHGIPFTPAP